MKIDRYPAYKDSAIEWLGEVPKHWSIKKTKTVCSHIRDGTHGSFSRVDIGYPLLSVRNIVNSKFVFLNDDSLISEEDYKAISKSLKIKKGDLQLAIVGATMGKVALVSSDMTEFVTQRSLATLRPIVENLNSSFFFYFASSSYFQDTLWSNTSYSAQPGIYLNSLSNIDILIPPPPEQRSIAHYLDTKTAQIDRKIDLLTQKATQYGNLKQSIVNEAVTRGLDRSVVMKDSGIEAIGCVPGHWEVKRFKEIFHKTHSGWTPDTTKQESFEGCNVWVTIRDMNDIYISNSLNKISNQAIQESGISLTPKGSLLFSFKLSIGKISFAGCDLYTNEAIISIEEGKNINLNYFYYTLPVLLILNAKENIYGAKLLNQSLIFNTSLLFPPLPEQETIAHYLDTKTGQIDQIIQTLNTQIETLKELRKTLINDVVTGKIKVV